MKISPFSSGGQWGDWTGCNCDRCEKGSHKLPPGELPTCELKEALVVAYLSDGNITADTADRIGYTANKGRYVWPCNEVVWTEEWKAEYERKKAVQL